MRIFCADVCRGLGEPLAATAPAKSAGWLLVQHPGPWPAVGLPDDLPAEMHKVAALATGAGVRPQLIRRTTGRAGTWPVRVYLGASGGPEPWIEVREYADPQQLATILDTLDPAALEAVATGNRIGFGAAVRDRMLLVCAHGSRDACCARAGRPLAVALARRYPDQVWETTHVGGDRFAANLVTLPDGSYHGGLDTGSGLAAAEATLRGEVVPRFFRGRAGRSAAGQAADWHAREHLGAVALGAVEVLAERPAADGTVQVDLRVGDEILRAVLRLTAPGPARLTSCATGAISTPEHYTLVELSATAPGERRTTGPAAEPSAR